MRRDDSGVPDRRLVELDRQVSFSHIHSILRAARNYHVLLAAQVFFLELGDAALGRRADQAGLGGEDDDLDAVAQAELGEDPRDMGLDRRLAERQRGGELRVAEAACDQADYLELAWCQRGQAGT